MHSVKMTTASNSGHPTSCSSMAEIMSVLFYRVMRYSVKEPKHPSNDRFVRLWLKYFFCKFHEIFFTFTFSQVHPVQGACRAHPVRGVGGGRAVPRQRPHEPAQDRLRPGGPPHPQVSCDWSAELFSHWPLRPQAQLHRRGHRVSGPGPERGLRHGVLRQVP